MRRGLFVLAGILFVIGGLAIAVVSTSKAKGTSRAVTTQGTHAITVTPWGPDQETIDAAKLRIAANPKVQAYLRGTINRLLSFDYIDNDTKATGRSEPPNRFRATYFDYTNNKTIVAEGGFYDSAVTVAVTNDQINPSPEEFDAAVAVVAADPVFGPAISSKKLEPYPPMPPLSTDPSIKGKPERTVTVGLFPTDDNTLARDCWCKHGASDGSAIRKRRSCFVKRRRIELRRPERGTGIDERGHCRSGRSRNQPRRYRVLAILMHTPFGLFGR